MLEADYLCALNGILATLPCDVTIPDGWKDFFQRRGALASQAEDHRRFVRYNMPTTTLLETGRSLPAIPRHSALQIVYMKDVSRRGAAFLASFQLYPEEQVQLWLTTGRRRCNVVRCCRRNERCFDIGVEFVNDDESQSKK